MKGRMIVLDHLGSREAAALLVDGKLDDLLIDDETAPRDGTRFLVSTTQLAVMTLPKSRPKMARPSSTR